ncbi:hypothetical protein B0T17DRAFT_228493 [Bombardia bombarda]|uniref:Uncharacterized protein n=1 Tax=Bombardia bombarda TaxID=252184 RepID=A0AA39XB69_9PEZI|nr:hypothetical protein B0T17DRAFT_228493 [Bombardia bombarda]
MVVVLLMAGGWLAGWLVGKECECGYLLFKDARLQRLLLLARCRWKRTGIVYQKIWMGMVWLFEFFVACLFACLHAVG